MQDKKIILIAGSARAGKDTVADIIVSKVDKVTILHYADLMKEILAETLGMSLEELEDRKNSGLYAHRKYLQRFGMKMREVFGEDIWVNKLKQIIQHIPSDHLIVIPDFRLPNEALDGATTIKVVNPNIAKKDTHISENALSNFEFDIIVVNDGTLEQLEDKVKDILKELIVSNKLPSTILNTYIEEKKKEELNEQK